MDKEVVGTQGYAEKGEIISINDWFYDDVSTTIVVLQNNDTNCFFFCPRSSNDHFKSSATSFCQINDQHLFESSMDGLKTPFVVVGCTNFNIRFHGVSHICM